MKKLLSLVLAAIMLCSASLALADDVVVNNQEVYEMYLAAEDNVMPICEPGEITLKIYVELDEYSMNFYQSYDEHPIVKEVEKATGLNLEFVHPPISDDGTFFNMTIAGGDYPDIFISSRFQYNYPGGIAGAQADGVLADNDALIRKYAKYFLRSMTEAEKSTYKNIADDNGKLTMGSSFMPEFMKGLVNEGFIARKDILEKYELEVPKTVDEMTAVLRVLKEKGIEAPLALGTLDNYRYTDGNQISAPWGVALNAWQLDENGKVFYSRAADGFKEFLKQMAAWYAEGLIDRDFVNRNAKDALKLLYNDRGVFCVVGNWQTTEAMALGTAENPDFDLTAVRPLRLSDPEEQLHVSFVLTEGGVGDLLISSTCKHPEAAVKFLDYLYNLEVAELAYWGVGELEDGRFTYVMTEDGKHEYGNAIMEDPDWPYETIRHKYTLQIFQRHMLEEPERFEYSDAHCQENWDAWGYNVDDAGLMPTSVSRTADEDLTFNGNQVEIQSYSDEMMYKFIVGTLDVDATWDEYLKGLKDRGLEANTAIQQAAYERWLQR